MAAYEQDRARRELLHDAQAVHSFTFVTELAKLFVQYAPYFGEFLDEGHVIFGHPLFSHPIFAKWCRVSRFLRTLLSRLDVESQEVFAGVVSFQFNTTFDGEKMTVRPATSSSDENVKKRVADVFDGLCEKLPDAIDQEVVFALSDIVRTPGVCHADRAVDVG